MSDESTIEFPTILYKDVGQYQRAGGTYSTAAVETQEDYDAKIAEGWVTHPDFIGKEPVKAAEKAPADDNAPPTREELEAKATELGIDFTAKTTDKKLAGLIEAALALKE